MVMQASMIGSLLKSASGALSIFSSPQDWLLVTIVVLVLFGAKKIPELARSVGQAVGEVQKGLHESQRQIQESARAAQEQAEKPAAEATPVAATTAPAAEAKTE